MSIKATLTILAKDSASKVFGTVGSSLKKVGDIAKKIAAAGVAAFSVALGVSIKNATTQQNAVNELTEAMKNNGSFTMEARDSALAYAAALQKQSTFGDEAILSAQALLVRLGDLSGEGLEKATQATLDLAAAKGIDLKTAAELVGKSVGSSTNALARYGVQIEGAAGSTERLNSLTSKAADIFGGAALAKTKTFSGQITQMQNRLGDVSEKIGLELLPVLQNQLFPVFESGIQVLEKFFDGKRIAKWIVGLKESFLAGGLALDLFKLTIDKVIIGFQNLALTSQITALKIKDVFTDTTDEIKRLEMERLQNSIELSQKETEIWQTYADERTRIDNEYQQTLIDSEARSLGIITDSANKQTEVRSAALKEQEKALAESKKYEEEQLKTFNNALISASQSVSDILISEEEDKGKAILKMIQRQLMGVIDAIAAAEIGKALAGAPLSFGATLAAIGPIVAAQTAAKASIGAIKFHDGTAFATDGGNVARGKEFSATLQGGERVLSMTQNDEMIGLLRSIDRKLNGGGMQSTPKIMVSLDGRELSRSTAKYTQSYQRLNQQGSI